MECLINNEMFSELILHYGSFALFILLMLGIVALPVPEETMMVFSGFLMGQGNLHIPSTLLAAYAGSIAGITVSYLLGRTLGFYCVHKYGSWLGLTEERLKRAEEWFRHYGKWLLTIGYFIPGVRHFTGLTAGISKIDYPQFAFFAYSGAILWVTLFLSIGYFLSDYCLLILEHMDIAFGVLIVFVIVLVVLGNVLKRYLKLH